MRLITTAVLLLALTSAGCASHTSGSTRVATAARIDPFEQLQRDLGALFADPALEHASWSVKFQSLASGAVLYSRDATRFLLPASNQKLLTTAVAAERLGWDYRFTTRIYSTGAVDANGTLTGDLVIVGNGDPTINPRHPDRWKAFDDWAAALDKRGIRIINGDIIGDDNAFDEPGWGTGWTWDNLQYGFGTRIGALQYNEDQIELMIGPGLEPGARAIISTTPLGHGMVIDHGVTTSGAETETNLAITRIPGSAILQVRGQVAAGAKPATITASVENPTKLYVAAVREAMGRHGIFVSGNVLDIDDLRAPPDLTHATELIVDRSAPLSEIVDVCLKWSRNEYAETLLYALSPPGTPATAAGGLEAINTQLAAWGIGRDLYLARDGSGLSRMDYVSAEALARLLTQIWKDPKLADAFRGSLPQAGVSGSLAERMKGTPAEAHVWAKTGTLSNVRALSGYMMTPTGEPIVFSMIANNYRLPTTDVDAVMEKALNRVMQAPAQTAR